MYLIGDIAGQFDALTRLIEMLPTKEEIILLGDLIDRGPKSKEVVEFAMSEENVTAIKGNHEQMLLDAYDDPFNPIAVMDCLRNGGYQTASSYGANNMPELIKLIPKTHIMFLRQLPLYVYKNGILATHTPCLLKIEELYKLETDPGLAFRFLWNRHHIEEIPGTFQVFGHNSFWGLKWFGGPDKPWGVCIDTSNQKTLTALHWPSLKIYQADY